jgi:hypothetical protein
VDIAIHCSFVTGPDVTATEMSGESHGPNEQNIPGHLPRRLLGDDLHAVGADELRASRS